MSTSGPCRILAALTLAIAFSAAADAQTAPQAAAPATLDDVRRLLDEQRALIDRQAVLLEAQDRELAALRKRIDEVSTLALGATNAVAELKQQPAAPTTAAAIEQRLEAIEKTVQRAPEMPAAAVSAGEFPGSIRVPGTDAAFKLGGQARMVLVHTLAPLGVDDRFITSSIPVEGTQSAGEDKRTTYSPEASRLNLELRSPSRLGDVRMFIEGDFAGSGNTVRLRHAFMQARRWIVGQTWSTFSDPEAEPIGIDFEGLNAISLFRQPQVRFTQPIRDNLNLAMAVENPAPGPRRRRRCESHARFHYAPAMGPQRSPAGSASAGADSARAGGDSRADAAGRADRPSREDADDRRVRRQRQRGARAAVERRRSHQVRCQQRVGDRALRHRSRHAGRPGRGVRFNRGQSEGATGVLGVRRVRASVEAHLHVAITYGLVRVENLDIQPGEALHETQRGTINLTWTPISRLDLVIEFLTGRRVNKDGAQGTSSQIQAGWTFRF
jgi:DcaP outer membrane protein